MDRRISEQYEINIREKAAYTTVTKWTDITELRNLEVLWRTAEGMKPKWVRKRKQRSII